jgi:hypothetical protein
MAVWDGSAGAVMSERSSLSQFDTTVANAFREAGWPVLFCCLNKVCG